MLPVSVASPELLALGIGIVIATLILSAAARHHLS
jgi:hypothetical protein